MEHEIYVSREKRGLGHPESIRLIRKAAAMALEAEGIGRPCLISVMLTDDEGIRRQQRLSRRRPRDRCAELPAQ